MDSDKINLEKNSQDFIFPFDFNVLIKVGEEDLYEGHNDYYSITDFYKNRCVEYANTVNSIVDNASLIYPELTKIYINPEKLNFTLTDGYVNDFCMLLYHPYSKDGNLAKYTFSIALREKDRYFDDDFGGIENSYSVTLYFNKDAKVARVELYLSNIITVKEHNSILRNVTGYSILTNLIGGELIVTNIYEDLNGDKKRVYEDKLNLKKWRQENKALKNSK